MPAKKMKYTRAELMVTTSTHDDGQHRLGHCALCKAEGWLNRGFRHKDTCPLGSDLVLAVELTALLDPAKLCPKCDGEGSVNHWFDMDDSQIIQCPSCRGSGLNKVPENNDD
jgi:hypothetical protein